MNEVCTAIPIIAVACACSALAAQPPQEPRSLAECAAIESAASRLDCFDALARRERGGDAAAPEVQSDAAPRPSESASSVPRGEAPDAAEVSRRDARAKERELTSHVVALREIQPGRLEVTLSNGQVWRQTDSDRYNLLVGHEVRVYPSGFGQYFRLSSTKARGYIQVERVR